MGRVQHPHDPYEYNKLAFRKGRGGERERVHRCKLQRPDEEPHHPKRRTAYQYQHSFFHFGDVNGGAPGGGA